MNNKIKNMTGIAIFSALIIILSFLSGYIKIGMISITLTLFPIAMGAIIYGPSAGFFLGLVTGFLTLIDQNTQVLFFANYPLQTTIVCLLKTSIAGLLSGYIYRLLKNKNFNLSIIISSMIVPITNTFLFSIAMLTVFRPLLDSWSEGNIFGYLLISMIGVNFIVEFIINSALTPIAISLTKIRDKIN